MDSKTPFEKFAVSVITWLVILILGAPFSLLNGLILMVAIGAVHGWIPAAPTAGYWTSVLIAYGLTVLSPLRAPSDTK